MSRSSGEPIEILLVEDNPGDIALTQEALRRSKISNKLSVVNDGDAALAYLHQRAGYEGSSEPQLILLDLNLPGMDGREVLEQIKSDPKTRRIPVVVMTTSNSEQDIVSSYDSHANCYITKPVNMDSFKSVVQSIDEFWFSVVQLPTSASERG